jgi:hypothetical protein
LKNSEALKVANIPLDRAFNNLYSIVVKFESISIDGRGTEHKEFYMEIKWQLCWLTWLLCQLAALPLFSQQVQFPTASPYGAPATVTPPNFNVPGAQLNVPNFTTPNYTPINPGFTAPPAFTQPPVVAQPNSGGFFGGSNPFSSWFGGQPANAGWSQPAPNFNTPNFNAPNFGNPTFNPSPYSSTPPAIFTNPPNPNVYGPPPVGTYSGPYPNQFGPSGSNTLFPNGLWGPNAANGQYPIVDRFRFLQHPRLSETYLYGADKTNDVQIHDIELAVTGALPNFLISTQPLYVTPTYVHHLWDGPQGIAADLPANAYSAFLDTFWASDPDRPLGVEVGVAVGAFTDFDTFTTKSLRVMGEGFGVARLTPQLTFKFGAWYLNRNDLKLLPAGGLVWQPNPQTKFDLLFPNPKLSKYLTSYGNGDVWWYVSGEYGGGAWTIKRADGSGDRVDINDIRVKLGIDWINQRNFRGFAEIGYVFDRQVVYVVHPADSFKPRDTFLIGAGFSF